MSPFLFVGVGCVLAGLCQGAKQFLTSKESVNYPTQSWHAQVTGWLWATGLIYRGGVILCSVWVGHPRLDDGSVVFATFLTTLFTASRLADVVEAKAPARAWKRMNQMQAVMHCRRWAWISDPVRRYFGLPIPLEKPDPERAAAGAALMAMDTDAELVVGARGVPEEWVPPEPSRWRQGGLH